MHIQNSTHTHTHAYTISPGAAAMSVKTEEGLQQTEAASIGAPSEPPVPAGIYLVLARRR